MIHNLGDEWMPNANLRSMEVESGSSSTVKADSGITEGDNIVSLATKNITSGLHKRPF